MAEIEEILEKYNEQHNRYDAEAAFAWFLQRKHAAERNIRRVAMARWAVGIAASLLVLVGLTYYSYNLGKDNLTELFSNITVTAPQGSVSDVSLPDGTKVVLNAGSTLTYSQGFGMTNRDVSLSGEGYFDVAKNKALPFTVTTDDSNVRVLGTKFTLSDYPKDDKVYISLVAGSVSFANADSVKGSVTLIPNQVAILDKRSGEISVSDCEDAKTYHSWTTGELNFTGQSLSIIAKILSHAYDVNIDVSEKKQDLHFYGQFYRRSQSIREILDALSATGKINYTIKGREIKIF